MKNIKVILTKQQQKVLDFVTQYIYKQGFSPTIAEIAKAIKKPSTRSVIQYLNTLTKKGLITRERYKSRSIQLVNPRKNESFTITLPVFASAGCGSPSVIAQRAFDEFIDVASNLIRGRKKENLYVIKAVGNSMNEAGINDGDYVLVERIADEEIAVGDAVVAIIEDNAVIKKYLRSDDLIILQPVSSDTSHRPIILDSNSTYKIFGKVLKTIRMPKTQDYQYIPLSA